MASTHLQKTMVTATSKKTWCFSAWVKRSSIGNDQRLFTALLDGSNYTILRVDGDKLHLLDNKAGSSNVNVKTNRLLRDTNAWYHIFVQVDTTQSTLSDQIKFYINGTRETSLQNAGYPGQNYDFPIGTSSYTMYIGRNQTSGDYWDGSMAHVHFVDGSAETSTTFGETDSTTGIWKPITSPSISEYGNNGVFLDFADSSAMGNDVSGKNNDYTVSGTMTQTIDTPSNVFATVNALQAWYPTTTLPTLSNGNTTIRTGVGASSSAGYFYYTSTLGVSSGKYYFEVKPTETTGNALIGIVGRQPIANAQLANIADGYSYQKTGNKRNNGTSTAYGATYTDNDIIGVAVDLDNNKIYFSKNGTWQNSGDPTSGATGTGSAFDLSTSPQDTVYYAVVSDTDYAEQSTFNFNFGNGYFGTTAVASAGTNSGIGTFEYDVPSGYKALCTKNINAEEYS